MNEERVLAQLLGPGDKIRVCHHHHHADGFPCRAEWEGEAVVSGDPDVTLDKVTVPWKLCDGGTSIGVSAYGFSEEVTRIHHQAPRGMAA